MYYGQRQVNLYDPIDSMSVASGGMSPRERGAEMQKWHDKLDRQDEKAQQEHDMGMQQSMYQAAHERNLQAAEQQRRAYDSQTARQTALDNQARKYSVLGDLLRNRPMG